MWPLCGGALGSTLCGTKLARICRPSRRRWAVHLGVPQVAAATPCDWRMLKKETKLHSFATVLIGPRDAPIGTLSVAREEKDGFDDREW
jgi:hypothetical protein